MYALRKRRITLMPAIALAALSGLIAIPALSPSRLFAAAPQHYATVTVERGQNLWAIADGFTADGQSVQDTIDHIMTVNGMTSATIHPGERLKIPR